MTPKGKKTGKGRRNQAAQRVDQLFAEVRELRAQVTALERYASEQPDMRIIGTPFTSPPITPDSAVGRLNTLEE